MVTPAAEQDRHDARIRALVVPVNYRSNHTVLKLLDGIRRIKNSSAVRVIIADNATDLSLISALRQVVARMPNVELLESGSNRGYFGAAKYALLNYLSQNKTLPDWIIVCNHDILIEDESLFEKLFGWNVSAVGVIAPRIRLLSQPIDQNPFMKTRPNVFKRLTMRFQSSCYAFAQFWNWLSFQKRKVLAARSMRFHGVAQSKIYAGHGAFLIFSRHFFEIGGDLDGELFLFGEEIAVGETCHRLGLSVVYDPNLCVFHDEHQSMGSGVSHLTYKYHRQAVRYVLKRYLTS